MAASKRQLKRVIVARFNTTDSIKVYRDIPAFLSENKQKEHRTRKIKYDLTKKGSFTDDDVTISRHEIIR